MQNILYNDFHNVCKILSFIFFNLMKRLIFDFSSENNLFAFLNSNNHIKFWYFLNSFFFKLMFFFDVNVFFMSAMFAIKHCMVFLFLFFLTFFIHMACAMADMEWHSTVIFLFCWWIFVFDFFMYNHLFFALIHTLFFFDSKQF